jgi:hypothetical protein
MVALFLTYEAVRACALAMLMGAVLQADNVSAGRGLVVDWRTVKSGKHIQVDGDAFDTAQLFVALVGAETAMASLGRDGFADVEPPPAVPKRIPEVTAYRPNEHGMRVRQFTAPRGFKVVVHPSHYGDDHTDADAAAFTARLAELAEGLS